MSKNRTKPPVEKKSDDEAPKNNTSPLINQAEIEYKALTGYFKTLVQWTLGAIAILLAVAGFLFYNNIKDLKDDLRAEKDNIKADLEKEKTKMQNELLEIKENYKTTTQDLAVDVMGLQNKALSQIDAVKSDAVTTARNAANKEIENTFKKNNLDTLITDIARNHMKPQVTKMIDEASEQKITDALMDAVSKDVDKSSAAQLFLTTNSNCKLNSKQIELAINIYKDPATALDAKYIPIILLKQQKSKEVANFFDFILSTVGNDEYKRDAIKYLLAVYPKTSFKPFVKGIETSPDKYGLYYAYIEMSANSSSYSTIDFLNSAEIINMVVESIKLEDRKNKNEQVKQTVIKVLTEEQYKKTYFYNKTI